MSNEIELYRIKDVLKRIPLSKSLWYRMVSDGVAPKPLKLSARTSMWKKSDIDLFVSKAASGRFQNE